MRHQILIILAILLLKSCAVDSDPAAIILPEHALNDIEERVDQFELRKQRECREKALRLALEKVDSTLLGMELLIQIDSSVIQRPLRPMRPEMRQRQDTVSIKPFIQSTKTDSM